MSRLSTLWRHLWLDAGDAERAIGKDGLDRLELSVSASEAQHSGQICLCIEASLPARPLWQLLRRQTSIEAIVHERALSIFGKERVWDTAHNNGVLIYVLLAERRLEIIVDRGLAAHLDDEQWQAAVDAGCLHLRNGQIERGLDAVMQALHHHLLEHFPRDRAGGNGEHNLPDRPRLL